MRSLVVPLPFSFTTIFFYYHYYYFCSLIILTLSWFLVAGRSGEYVTVPCLFVVSFCGYVNLLNVKSDGYQ